MNRYLALGDSYTIGEGVLQDDAWPYQLCSALNQLEMSISSPTVIARTGWTCAELATALKQTGLKGPYDLVTLMVGVNDQYRGYDIADFDPIFRKLLLKAIDLAAGKKDRVITISIPDWGGTPFAVSKNSDLIAKEIDIYNHQILSICQQHNISYVDVTAISRVANNKSEMLAADGLHPSKHQYELWVKQMIPTITQCLNQGL